MIEVIGLTAYAIAVVAALVRLSDYLDDRAARRRTAANGGTDPLDPANWTYREPKRCPFQTPR